MIALALCMKIIIPAGMMVNTSSKHITVQVCTGMGITERTLVIPMERTPDDGHKNSKSNDVPCAYSALSMAGTHDDPANLFAAALAFIFALGFAACLPSWQRITRHLRPPLRGPPTLI